MQKQEFEERIERTVTDEQYKVIEEVYMWHPSILISDSNGKPRAFSTKEGLTELRHLPLSIFTGGTMNREGD